MLQFLVSAGSKTCFSILPSSCLLYALATMVLLIAPFSDAALPCSCSPLTYEWTLDFKAGGCPGNLTEILDQVDGITNNSMCQLYTTTDIAPKHVSELSFYEYGAGLHDLVNYRVQRGKWNNTDTMSVHSITSEDPTIVTSSATIELSGTKEDGSSFLFIWLADYTNACNVESYDGIESISYLNFTNSRMNPNPSTCYPCKNSKSSKSQKSWSYKYGPKSSKSKKGINNCDRHVVKASKSKKSSKSSKSWKFSSKGKGNLRK